MNRDEAWAIVTEYTASDSLRKHMLSVEAAMRAYAPRYEGDVELWGVVGLLHDFDYERYPDVAVAGPSRRRIENSARARRQRRDHSRHPVARHGSDRRRACDDHGKSAVCGG